MTENVEIQTSSLPRRGKTWLIRLLLALSTVLLVFILGEVGLRLLGVEYPRTSQTDPYRATAWRPGIEWWQTEEGKAHIKINRAGFRDRERSPSRLPNTVRIAVLGDSMVDALQVSDSKRLTEVMEQELNQRHCFAPNKVEVLNFGYSGYGTAQELMVLRHHVWAYQPDIVILAFMTGNDVRNNSRRLQNDPMRPYFVFQDGKLVLDASFRDTPGYRKSWWELLGYKLLDWSRIGQLSYQARETLQKRRAVAEARASFTQLPQELGLDTLVFREPTDDAWREAWAVTEALLALMHKEVHEKGAKFFVVTLTNGIQVNPDLSARRGLMEQLGVASLTYPDERIKSVGHREGFPVLNLVPLFQEYVEKHKAYLHGFKNSGLGSGHWNEEGHRLAGEFIANEICRLKHSAALAK